MPTYRVSVYYSTRAYIDVNAETPDDAEEDVSMMDWRNSSFTVVDGSANIEGVEEITE